MIINVHLYQMNVELSERKLMMQHAALLLHFFVVSTSRLLSMFTHLGQESLLVKNTHGVEDQEGSFQETVETKGHV